jgi:hypothetical protein
MFSGTAQISHQVCQFFCQFCWVPWDYAIVVSAGKLRTLWDFLSELRSSSCERRLERTVVRPALLPVRTARFTQHTVDQSWPFLYGPVGATPWAFACVHACMRVCLCVCKSLREQIPVFCRLHSELTSTPKGKASCPLCRPLTSFQCLAVLQMQ